jgi:4-hydroxy-3-polyprenylbenzoate decarboxylase
VDLRSFIGSPEPLKGLSVDFEIAKALFNSPDKTVYFSEVECYDFNVVGNVVTDREDVYRALRSDKEKYITDVLRFLKNPIEPVVIEKGECQEGESSLYDIPILSHFEKDGGKYITSGIVIAKDEEYGPNASIHRLMVKEDNQLGIRIVPRHLFEYLKRAEAKDEDLEIAVAIGVHPKVFYSASYSPPLGYDEFKLAGAILGSPLEVVKCKTVDIEVPAHAEFVIEGKILCNERAPEGPFADVTGTYDRIRSEPVIEVSRVTHRRDAIYHALLPSSIEHRLFMGMPREPRMYDSLKMVSEVSNVCLSDGGRNWLQGVVSLKRGSFNIKEVIESAFKGHSSMKHVIIVDEDINIFDPDAVEYAISTRFQAHKDAYVFKNMRGSTLDPSTDEDGKTTKVGIDATIPVGRETEYEFARIP